jgi:hypothetical protein
MSEYLKRKKEWKCPCYGLVVNKSSEHGRGTDETETSAFPEAAPSASLNVQPSVSALVLSAQRVSMDVIEISDSESEEITITGYNPASTSIRPKPASQKVSIQTGPANHRSLTPIHPASLLKRAAPSTNSSSGPRTKRQCIEIVSSCLILHEHTYRYPE